ncbi:MAG: hypothetical protein VYA25_03070, partial [Pseudomonadota bacterium]|nr:hypothetical protein [Pseudomonadota bacterium]
MAVTAIETRITHDDRNWLGLRWRIETASELVLPAPAGKRREDGLWQTTCFELFLQPDGVSAYCEFNLSPSERWAAYDFSAPRAGMAQRALPRDPVCTMRAGSRFAIFDAAIPRAG